MGEPLRGASPTVPVATVPAMGSIYAIANQKGGVGKTTTAVNVAACIAEAGYPSLLVDIDPQANATVGLGHPKDTRPSIYEVLTGAVRAADAIVESSIPGLHLLPANPDLAGANMELPRRPGSETSLRDALTGVRERFAFSRLGHAEDRGKAAAHSPVSHGWRPPWRVRSRHPTRRNAGRGG